MARSVSAIASRRLGASAAVIAMVALGGTGRPTVVHPSRSVEAKHPLSLGASSVDDWSRVQALTFQDTGCPSDCARGCEPREATRVLFVLGAHDGPAGYREEIERVYRDAQQRLDARCGAVTLTSLDGPTASALGDVVAAQGEELNAFIFIGHGSERGIALRGGVTGEVLAPRDIHADFVRAGIPHLQLFACSQGTEELARAWAAAARPRRLAAVPGLLHVAALAREVAHQVDSVPCNSRKLVCRGGDGP